VLRNAPSLGGSVLQHVIHIDVTVHVLLYTPFLYGGVLVDVHEVCRGIGLLVGRRSHEVVDSERIGRLKGAVHQHPISVDDGLLKTLLEGESCLVIAPFTLQKQSKRSGRGSGRRLLYFVLQIASEPPHSTLGHWKVEVDHISLSVDYGIRHKRRLSHHRIGGGTWHSV